MSTSMCQTTNSNGVVGSLGGFTSPSFTADCTRGLGKRFGSKRPYAHRENLRPFEKSSIRS